MPRSLPSQPNWNFLRQQAKQVLKDHSQGDATVCPILRQLRRFSDAANSEILGARVTLGEVQLALALDYGFASWNALRDHVDGHVKVSAPDLAADKTVTVRPIERTELDRVVLRCWPHRDVIHRLFDKQGTIGFAAWEDGRCVAEHIGYRLERPDQPNEDWPFWNNWWRPQDWKKSTREAVMDLPGPIWCHACFHVGRTLKSNHQEMLSAIRTRALKHNWDPKKVCDALNAQAGVWVKLEHVAAAIRELQESGQREFQTIERKYHRRRIGTALCAETVRWAREHGYRSVLASAMPADLPAKMHLSGGLPWTTFAKLGYRDLGYRNDETKLPAWVEMEGMPPSVMDAVRSALAAGRKSEEFHHRLMVVDMDGRPV